MKLTDLNSKEFEMPIDKVFKKITEFNDDLKHIFNELFIDNK